MTVPPGQHAGEQKKRGHQSPEAIVRIVPHGGARTAAQIRDQLKYLSRKGEVHLQRSERHLGIFLAAEQIADTAVSWAEETGQGGAAADEDTPDLTTHIVISFPEGTEPAKAFAAGRAFAEEMFGRGQNGGSFDYLTACHSDRPHPHVHLVVNRRALEGHWLKISRRHSSLNYEKMRSTMAEVARHYGIELVATSRLQRGITERPITYAEYRRRARRMEVGAGRADPPSA
jgi:type IV secretion system T-DNA border endonuclease VirD2